MIMIKKNRRGGGSSVVSYPFEHDALSIAYVKQHTSMWPQQTVAKLMRR